MKLVLGTLARSGIEACSGSDIHAGVEAALRYYTQTRERQPPPPSVPRLGAGELGTCVDDELELSLDPEIERALTSEAQRNEGVSAGQLGAHAVLVYLADHDRSGAEVLQAPGRS
jgi:hypothetical protein